MTDSHDPTNPRRPTRPPGKPRKKRSSPSDRLSDKSVEMDQNLGKSGIFRNQWRGGKEKVKIRVIDDQGNVSEKTIEEIWADLEKRPRQLRLPMRLFTEHGEGVELSLDMPKVFQNVERMEKEGNPVEVEKIRGYLGTDLSVFDEGVLYVLISIAKNQIGKVERDFSVKASLYQLAKILTGSTKDAGSKKTQERVLEGLWRLLSTLLFFEPKRTKRGVSGYRKRADDVCVTGAVCVLDSLWIWTRKSGKIEKKFVEVNFGRTMWETISNHYTFRVNLDVWKSLKSDTAKALYRVIQTQNLDSNKYPKTFVKEFNSLLKLIGIYDLEIQNNRLLEFQGKLSLSKDDEVILKELKKHRNKVIQNSKRSLKTAIDELKRVYSEHYNLTLEVEEISTRPIRYKFTLRYADDE